MLSTGLIQGAVGILSLDEIVGRIGVKAGVCQIGQRGPGTQIAIGGFDMAATRFDSIPFIFVPPK